MALSMHRLARFSGMGKNQRGWEVTESETDKGSDGKATKKEHGSDGDGLPRARIVSPSEERESKEDRKVEAECSDVGIVSRADGSLREERSRKERIEEERRPSTTGTDPRSRETKREDVVLEPFASFKLVKHAEKEEKNVDENVEVRSTVPAEEGEEEDDELFGSLDVWRWRFYRKWKNEMGRNMEKVTEEEEGDDLDAIEFLRACTQDAANNFVTMSLEPQSRESGHGGTTTAVPSSSVDIHQNGSYTDPMMLRRASLGQLLMEDPVVGALSNREESPPGTESQWMEMDASRQKFASKLRSAKQLIEHQAMFETRAAEKWATTKGRGASQLDTLLPVSISRSTTSAYVLFQAYDTNGKKAYIIRSKPCENGSLNSEFQNILNAVVLDATEEIRKTGGQAHIIGGGLVTWKMDTGKVLVVKIPVETWKLDFIEGREISPHRQVWELCEFARFSVILLKQNLPYEITVRWEEEQSHQQLFF